MMPDPDKLNEFLSKFVNDLGAALHAGMVVIGDELGLYKALAREPMTSRELSEKTRTDERYLREWLSSQAAGGYVEYDRESHKFSLRPIDVSGAAREAPRGSLIPSPTFAGVATFRVARWPKSSGTGRKNCSGVSTSSETSTMTGGRAELSRLDNPPHS